jgi:hypothetical protein
VGIIRHAQDPCEGGVEILERDAAVAELGERELERRTAGAGGNLTPTIGSSVSGAENQCLVSGPAMIAPTAGRQTMSTHPSGMTRTGLSIPRRSHRQVIA